MTAFSPGVSPGACSLPSHVERAGSCGSCGFSGALHQRDRRAPSHRSQERPAAARTDRDVADRRPPVRRSSERADRLAGQSGRCRRRDVPRPAPTTDPGPLHTFWPGTRTRGSHPTHRTPGVARRTALLLGVAPAHPARRCLSPIGRHRGRPGYGLIQDPLAPDAAAVGDPRVACPPQKRHIDTDRIFTI